MDFINKSSFSRLEMLTRNIIEYVDTRWEIIQLNLTERGLAASATIVSGLMLTLFGSIILVFVSIGTAIWLGQELRNPAMGFFIMAGVLTIFMGLALLFARSYIRTYITNIVLDSIKDEDDEELPS